MSKVACINTTENLDPRDVKAFKNDIRSGAKPEDVVEILINDALADHSSLLEVIRSKGGVVEDYVAPVEESKPVEDAMPEEVAPKEEKTAAPVDEPLKKEVVTDSEPATETAPVEKSTPPKALFSRSPSNLFVTHNISEEGVIAADELGGLAAPSLAVARADLDGFDSFGNISLLADPAILSSSKTRTFDADIYTPRQARAHHKVNSKELKSFVDSLATPPAGVILHNPDAKMMRGQGGMDAFARNEAVIYDYLNSIGKTPKLKKMKATKGVIKASKLEGMTHELQTNPEFIKLAEQEYRDIAESRSKGDAETKTELLDVFFDGENSRLDRNLMRSFADDAIRYNHSDGLDAYRFARDLQKKLRVKSVQRDYDSYVKSKFNRLIEGKLLLKGTSNTAGRQQFTDYTLSNVVREMTRNLQAGENFFHGAGQVRSAYANELKTLSDIKASRDKIIPNSEMAAVKDQATDVLNDAVEKLKPFYKYDAESFGYTDDAVQSIADGRSGINETFNVTPEVEKIVADLTEYLQALDTDYFEVKMQRSVQFEEFDTAVVPKGVNPESLKILKDAGLKVRYYDEKVEGKSRKEIVAKQERLLFSKQGRNYKTSPPLSTVDEINAELSTAISRLDKAIQQRVKIVQTTAELPTETPSDVKGMYYDGIAYVVADNTPVSDAKTVLTHEIVGHMGLEEVLGDSFADVIGKIKRMKRVNNKQITDIVKTLKKNYTDGNDNYALSANQEAREILAHIAETDTNHSLVKQLIAKLKLWLARMGLANKDSAEIGYLIAQASRYVDGKGDAVLITASGNIEPYFAKAYHGSPHKHDGRLDPSKIGTGEGAQAYGYGYYVAESQDVADGYRHRLSDSYTRGLQEYRVADIARNPSPAKANSTAAAIIYHLSDNNSLSDADLKKIGISPEDVGFEDVSDTIKASRLKSYDYGARSYAGDVVDGSVVDVYYYSDGSGLLRKDGGELMPVDAINKGHLYEYDIDDDAISKMLDWDAPFALPPKAGKDLAALLPNTRVLGDSSNGAAIYQALSRKLGGDQSASDHLKSLGIPGIKYYDGESRGDGEGTRNFVIFPGSEDIATPVSRNSELFSRDDTSTEAHARAQRNAALPVSEGGLGLPADNTAMDRAKAMGFDVDTTWYHGANEVFRAFKTKVPSKRYTTFTEKDVESQGVFLSNVKDDAATYGNNVMELMAREGQLLRNPMDTPITSKSSAAEKAALQRQWDDIEYILEPVMYSENGAKYIDVDSGISRTEVEDDGKWINDAMYDGRMDWDYLDNPEVVSRMGERGYDSVKVYEQEGEAGESLFIASPSNIRSVNAAFDPMEKDSAELLFSRGDGNWKDDSTGFAIPDETWKTVAIRKLQDKFKVLKDLQANIIESGGEISEEANAYIAEELFHGKAENDIAIMRDEFVAPMAEKMAESGITQAQLDKYLYALHAEERNDHIASINPDMPDGGSGMKTSKAKKIIADIEQGGKAADYKDLAGIVHAMLRERRRVIIDGGLEDDGLIDAWEDKYKNYVPLKGFAENELDDSRPKTGQGFNIGGKESKRALGRGSEAASPSSFAIIDLTETLVRNRKNEVGNALLKLIEDNPQESYWASYTEDNPDTDRRIVKVDGKDVVKETVIPMALMKDQYFTTKRNGKTHYMKLEDPRLMDAMKNLGVDHAGVVIRSMGNITRIMSALNTSYSPEFITGNFLRDVQTAVLNLKAEQTASSGKINGEEIVSQTVKDIPLAMRSVYASLSGKKIKGAKGKEFQDWFEEFKKAGAKTGWFDMKDLDGQAREVEQLVEMSSGTTKGNALKWAKSAAGVVENMNSAVENAVRLSAYVNARRAGISEQKAASLAKNMTVNFNRKGEVGATLNALFMFSNASIQGVANFARTMGTLKGDKSLKWQNLNNAQKLGVGMAAGAFFIAMANRSSAGEDDDGVNWFDKVPDYVKERNIVIMKSLFGGEQDGTYWKIPLPYGYNIFNVLGDSMESVAFSDKPVTNTAGRLTLATLGSFSPIGFQDSKTVMGGVLKNATPTVFKPVTDIALNENFFGSSIYSENFPFGTPKPDSAMARRSTPEGYRKVAEWLNEGTGGSKQRPGAVDINPDVMRYIADYFGGAAYGFFGSKVPDVVHRAINDVDVEVNRMPFVSRISGRVMHYDDMGDFYERRDEINQIHAEYKTLEGGERAGFYRKYGDKMRLSAGIKSAEKRLKLLRKQRDRVYANEDLSFAQRDERLKDVQAKMKKVVDEINKNYNNALTKSLK